MISSLFLLTLPPQFCPQVDCSQDHMVTKALLDTTVKHNWKGGKERREGKKEDRQFACIEQCRGIKIYLVSNYTTEPWWQTQRDSNTEINTQTKGAEYRVQKLSRTAISTRFLTKNNIKLEKKIINSINYTGRSRYSHSEERNYVHAFYPRQK